MTFQLVRQWRRRMTLDPNKPPPQKPQSSRYRCIIEELEKSRMVMHQIADQVRAQTIWLIQIHNLLERIIGDVPIEREGDGAHVGQAPLPPDPGEKPPEQAVPASQAETSSEVGETARYSPLEQSPTKIETPLRGQTATQVGDAEKARRVRHGEGLDLDEEHF